MCARASEAAALLGCLLLGACALSMEIPDGFLQLDTGGHEIKATTPDDALLWVREFDDDDEGGLAFWAEALENDLARSRGYARTGAREVRDGAGRTGREMTFRVQLEGEPRGYLVALFVIPGSWSNTIRVVELTAREEVFARHVEAVRAAIATLRP